MISRTKLNFGVPAIISLKTYEFLICSIYTKWSNVYSNTILKLEHSNELSSACSCFFYGFVLVLAFVCKTIEVYLNTCSTDNANVVLTLLNVVLTTLNVVLTTLNVVLTTLNVLLTTLNVLLTTLNVILTRLNVILTALNVVLTTQNVILTTLNNTDNTKCNTDNAKCNTDNAKCQCCCCRGICLRYPFISKSVL